MREINSRAVGISGEINWAEHDEKLQPYMQGELSKGRKLNFSNHAKYVYVYIENRGFDIVNRGIEESRVHTKNRGIDIVNRGIDIVNRGINIENRGIDIKNLESRN